MDIPAASNMTEQQFSDLLVQLEQLEKTFTKIQVSWSEVTVCSPCGSQLPCGSSSFHSPYIQLAQMFVSIWLGALMLDLIYNICFDFELIFRGKQSKRRGFKSQTDVI